MYYTPTMPIFGKELILLHHDSKDHLLNHSKEQLILFRIYITQITH